MVRSVVGSVVVRVWEWVVRVWECGGEGVVGSVARSVVVRV